MAEIHDKMQALHEEYDSGNLTLSEYYRRAGEMNLGFYKNKDDVYVRAGMLAYDIAGEMPHVDNFITYILAYQELREFAKACRQR